MTQKFDPWFRNGLIRNAIGQALYEEMQKDPLIHLFGEGCDRKVHYDAPLIERDFSDRVHTLPISEDGNNGFALGAALLGVKPVVDIITADFIYRAMDSLANSLAKLNFVQAKGESPKTVLVRAEYLTAGPTTSARPEAMLCHVPGLNVAVPSTPRDAYGMTRTALHTPGVTLLFEDRTIKDALLKGRPDDCGPLEEAVPFGKVVLRSAHSEARLTIVTYGLMRQVVEEALKGVEDTPLDLIDLRWVYPIDWEVLEASARKTDRVLIVEPDIQYGGVGAEIAAHLAEKVAPTVIRRVGAVRGTLPAAMSLHPSYMPTQERVLSAIQAMSAGLR